MNIILLDNNFIPFRIVDDYESFIWTDRFNQPGDFEYYNLANSEILSSFKEGYYLINDESDHAMIIESIETITDPEAGDKVRITGRSLESILSRRIIWDQTIINGNLQNGVKTLITKNVINPTIKQRKIDKFIFDDSKDDRITKLKLEAQYTGDDLDITIKDICDANKLGYKIVFDEDHNFRFSLYYGFDKSDAQNDRITVTFSYDYDNIKNMNYREDTTTLKNVALVAGEGEGTARKKEVIGSISGLERRELFVDARDLSTDLEGGGKLSDAEYKTQLIQRGKEKLSENVTEKTFDGEVDTTGLFQYKRDFELGDIVNFYDRYGNKKRVRIDEIIFNETYDENVCYPSFTVLEE